MSKIEELKAKSEAAWNELQVIEAEHQPIIDAATKKWVEAFNASNREIEREAIRAELLAEGAAK